MIKLQEIFTGDCLNDSYGWFINEKKYKVPIDLIEVSRIEIDEFLLSESFKFNITKSGTTVSYKGSNFTFETSFASNLILEKCNVLYNINNYDEFLNDVFDGNNIVTILEAERLESILKDYNKLKE